MAGPSGVRRSPTRSRPITSASYTEKSLENLGVSAIDLQQFHVWTDAWAGDAGWQRAVRDLKDEGLVRAFGISVNRWQPANVLRALDTGLIDSVQVVYNIFDQAPEDELFPYCEAHDIAIIARVPFDEGSLTGTLTAESRWPDGDWRNVYFNPKNLAGTLERVERLEPLVPEGMDLPGSGVAIHPGTPRRQHDDSRHAQASACRAEPGGQRRPPAAAAPAGRVEGSSMGPIGRHRVGQGGGLGWQGG